MHDPNKAAEEVKKLQEQNPEKELLSSKEDSSKSQRK